MHTSGVYCLWSLWLTFPLIMIKGLAQSSLESLKILHRNASASSLVSSVWQCYCGLCCSDACVKLSLKNLKLTLQPSCLQTPMISTCHSTSNVQVSRLRINICISKAVLAASELLLLKIRLTALLCLPEWAASCPGLPFLTASCQCSEPHVTAHFAQNSFILHALLKTSQSHTLLSPSFFLSQRYSIVNATCTDLGTDCLN